MYYENKRSFYIKQYGPIALVIVLALAFIISGVVIGIKHINPSEKPIIDADAYIITENAFQGLVTAVDGTTIIVKANNNTYNINLIGVMPNKNNPDLSSTISKDLVGKTVTVDYDNVRTEAGKVYGYIFIDGTLYNETLLAKGLAELRAERNNISKLNVLVEAQIQARHNELGIWEIK